MLMNIGQANHRLAIEQRSDAVDALGQAVETWTTVTIVWGQAEPIQGRERLTAGALENLAVIRFRIRYRPGVLASMRIRWRGLVHNIVGEPIDVGGRRVELELLCAEGASVAAAANNNIVTEAGDYLVTETGDSIVWG